VVTLNKAIEDIVLGMDIVAGLFAIMSPSILAIILFYQIGRTSAYYLIPNIMILLYGQYLVIKLVNE
jgi:tryptophan-rich sensory protein